MRSVYGALALGAALLQPASAANNEMLRCRAIVAAAERLACYDSLPLGAFPSTLAPPSAAGAPAPTAVASLPPGPPLGTFARPESSFGQPDRAVVVEREAIDSAIPGAFDGWRPGQRFTLANGQVWQIADESEGAYSRRDAKVRIVRGWLGGYFLYVEGIDQNPRVRRLK